MPPAPTATAGLAKLLDGTRVGRFKVPISQLSHTTSGRPLHASGVTTLVASMRDNGWLASPMTVCLIGAQPEDGLQQNIAGDHQYEMVNGNHRLAALKRLEADPDFESPTDIEVEVHTGMDADTQRLVASSECAVTSAIRVLWVCVVLRYGLQSSCIELYSRGRWMIDARFCCCRVALL